MLRALRHIFAILFRILTGAAITKMKGVSASNCTQVCKVETCQPPLVCAARAVRRPISSHCYPCDAIGAGARTLHAFQSLYKLPSENCVRLSTNIIPAELYLVSELKFLTTGQGRKCVSLSRNRGEIILNSLSSKLTPPLPLSLPHPLGTPSGLRKKES